MKRNGRRAIVISVRQLVLNQYHLGAVADTEKKDDAICTRSAEKSQSTLVAFPKVDIYKRNLSIKSARTYATNQLEVQRPLGC